MFFVTAHVVLIAVAFLLLECQGFSRPTATTRVEICQNKHCRRKFQPASPLPDILGILLTSLPSSSLPGPGWALESTGCLSQCDQGPNLRLIQHGGTLDESVQLLFSNTDVATVVGQLQNALAVTSAVEWTVPSKLLAATSVLDKGQKSKRLADKEKYFSSVINALDSDNDFNCSPMLAHAFILRAEARVEENLLNTALAPQTGANVAHLNDALLDIDQALQRLERTADRGENGMNQETAEKVVLSMKAHAFRVAADAHEALGQITQAMAALHQLSLCSTDKSIQKKIGKDYARLQERRSPETSKTT